MATTYDQETGSEGGQEVSARPGPHGGRAGD
jgi:hypothetical protein